MYEARVLRVLIASPSDVAAEREAARHAIHDWNAVHAEDRRVVLMPVGWDTHARPEMGDRPQAIINKQIAQAADLLIAVFWTRLGSPTGAAPSGTVEEIREHINAGKETMIYFSSAPVRPDSVDDDQYKALRAFRAECEKQGLVESYDSVSEFREKLSRHLAQFVIRRHAAAGEGGPAEVPRAAEQLRALEIESLSEFARELLVEASKDKQGTVMRLSTMGGLGIQTNRRQFSDRGNPRSEAQWDAALRQLAEQGLVRDAGHKGEVFNVTDLGYEVADRIQGGIGSR